MHEWIGEHDYTTGWTEEQFDTVHILLDQSLKTVQRCRNPDLSKLVLFTACRLNDYGIVEQILKSSVINVRELIASETDEKSTALSLTCDYAATESFNVILEECIKQNVFKEILMKQDQYGDTPLRRKPHEGNL